MELENKVTEQVSETTEVVSNEQTQQEWKAPTTKEEYELALKSAVNKSNTELLKSLGVKSIKEFKESYNKFEQDKTQLENINKELETYKNKSEEVIKENLILKQEKVMNELNIQEEYREDLLKLANEKVNSEKDLKTVLKEMIDTKYKYAVQSVKVKLGIEKSDTSQANPISGLAKKYSWIKE